MVLIAPFGVVSGYVMVTLAYQLKQAGVSVGQVAGLVALSVLPHTWKFFWAPVIDATLDQKKWYLLAGIPCAIGIAAMGFFPATKLGLVALSVIVFLASLTTTLVGMAVESLMAHSTPEEMKGRAGGWFQAGNLGGAGIGGGLGLFLVARLPAPWMASSIVGGLCLLCCTALAGVPTPARPPGKPGLIPGVTATLKDFWQLVRNRSGVLVLVLCVLPIGSGAASGLWSAVAGEWRASADTVALVSGVLGGIISAAGCIIGGWLCDRMDRKSAYVWFGILQAGVAVAMALFPRSPTMFVLWSSVYAFITGFTYAAFSAFVLEAIGKGAAATKYSALASLSNIPIYYMTNLNGWAHDRWDSGGMLFTEAGIGVLAAVFFVALAKLLRRRRTTSRRDNLPNETTDQESNIP
jgi:PAT family beta-lactamase induction signal transducer AmpG